LNKEEFSFIKSRGFLMILVIFVFIVIMAFFFGDSGIVEIVKTQDKIEKMRQRIADLELEKQRLTSEIEELKDNPLALERKAREKLWLMKKNEKVIVIVDKKDQDKNKKKNPRAKKKK